jgi:capsular polysaccharide transport system ATP-binding protein
MIACHNLGKSYRAGHGRKQVFSAINLTIKPGERIALLGRNGAGKSTFIKLIGGVELPDTGRIVREMSSSWPIGFNGGFQGSLTGYDNARFISRIYGRPYKEIREYVECFTELGRSLAMPVKSYSSGMRARLAFALSLAIEFDCYLIDEVILVGDHKFHEKCRQELFEKRADRALLIASHDTQIISDICNRALLIRDGTGQVFDSVSTAVEEHLHG